MRSEEWEEKNGKFYDIQKILYRVEDTILISLLTLMISMAVAQIVLRNLFGSGIVWGDVLVRILVLWIGLVGAMAASRKGNHICIDVLTRYLPERVSYVTDGVVNLFTAVICAIVTWHSFQFVRMEFEYGGNAFAQVPTWVCESVIPFAFAVIALRYFILSLTSFRQWGQTRRSSE